MILNIFVEDLNLTSTKLGKNIMKLHTKEQLAKTKEF